MEETPEAKLSNIISGFELLATTFVAAKLGISDLLAEGPKTTSQLAKTTKTDENSLLRVLRYLAANGVYENRGGKFALTPISELLRSDNEKSLRWAVISHGGEYYRAASQLMQSVITGESAFRKVFGKGIYQYYSENTEAGANFSRQMRSRARNYQRLTEIFNFRDYKAVVDVGGAMGNLLATVLQANPETHGILFDLPAALRESRDYLTSKGLAERCKIISGDAFESVPTGGDLYVLSRVLNCYSDQEALSILRNVKRAASNSGKAHLLIIEPILDEDKPQPMVVDLDLTMLYLFGGRVRTERRFKELLAQTHFSVTQVMKDSLGIDSLIEATAS